MVVGGQCGLGHATTTVVTKFPAPPPVFISNACRVSEASEAHLLFCHQFEAIDSFDILLPFILKIKLFIFGVLVILKLRSLSFALQLLVYLLQYNSFRNRFKERYWKGKNVQKAYCSLKFNQVDEYLQDKDIKCLCRLQWTQNRDDPCPVFSIIYFKFHQ